MQEFLVSRQLGYYGLKAAMGKLHFSVRIDAPRKKIWDTMLSPETYKAWTAPFCEGSYFEGSWEKGQRIRFLAPNGEGMSSIIAENRPHEFLSIQHVGTLKDGVEDTDSEQVRKWAPAFENYTLVSVDGGTEVRIDMDVEPEYEQYMTEAWPEALEKLKSLCESRRS
jgi:uncharacterized protein YndB with AHSA1/START domain